MKSGSWSSFQADGALGPSEPDDEPTPEQAKPCADGVERVLMINCGVEYREVSGFPDYFVGSDGSVWSAKPNGRPGIVCILGRMCRPLTLDKTWKGYLRARLSRPGMKKPQRLYVHCLVLETFVGPKPEGMECRHGDGVRSNNWLDNLSWGTPEQNWEDRKRHGRGRSHSKTTPEQVREVRRLAKEGVVPYRIAKRLEINPGIVWSILNGRTWKEVGENEG